LRRLSAVLNEQRLAVVVRLDLLAHGREVREIIEKGALSLKSRLATQPLRGMRIEAFSTTQR
jgi:hypothetical protein